MLKRHFLVLCFVLSGLLCKAQSYYFQNYQVDNGLSHNTVTAIAQDHKGFMWIGTKGGLNRFDGYYFKNFSIRELRSGENSVTALNEDKNGRLWIGTLSGLFLFDPYSELIKRTNFSLGNIHEIAHDKDNNLWLIANGKINTYNPVTGKDVNTEIDASAFEFDEHGVLWIGTIKGELKTISIDKKKFKLQDVQLSDKPLLSAPVTKILPYKAYILIGTRRGLFKYNVKTGELSTLLKRNADGTNVYIRDIKILTNGECWLATETGIFIYDLAANSYKNIKKTNRRSIFFKR